MNASISTIALSPRADDHAGAAANDGSVGPDYTFTDVELLVATTVARVTARVQSELVNVVLDLAADDAIVACDPTSLSFALAGILGALLRAADENGDEEIIRVVVTATERHVQVSIAGPDVPPLRMIRALADSAPAAMADPTVAHCRRIIERQGGSIRLGSSAGELAVELRLPAYPQGGGLRILPPRSLRHPARSASVARALAS